MTYRDDEGNIQRFALKQLEMLPENNIQEICFDHMMELYENEWDQIDTILVGDRFKSLKEVEVFPECNIRHLPRLNGKRVLSLCKDSFWH